MAPLRRFLVALAFGLALAARAADPVVTEDPAISAGVRFVETGDLERAIATLEAALTRLPGERTAARAAAHLYLGMAHVGLEHGSMARLHLREAWVLRAGEALDPRRYPPRVIELYEENRPARTPRPQPTPRSTPKASSPLPFALGAVAGAGMVGLMTSGGEAEASGHPTVRAFNCDDGCRIWLNGELLAEIAMGQDSGRIEVSRRLAAGGSNVVAFEVTNTHGAISYGFEVRVGEAIVFQEVCGVAARLGCEDDRPFPPGVARRYEYVFP
jgi:hypothetical protein